jgi:phosphoinositide-3-kinase regulatory subunit 4
MRVLLTMEHPIYSGPITTICPDRRHAWVVTGTASGVLTLWDIRFGLMIKTWKTVAAMTVVVPLASTNVLSTLVAARGRWISRSSGDNTINFPDVPRTTGSMGY